MHLFRIWRFTPSPYFRFVQTPVTESYSHHTNTGIIQSFLIHFHGNLSRILIFIINIHFNRLLLSRKTLLFSNSDILKYWKIYSFLFKNSKSQSLHYNKMWIIWKRADKNSKQFWLTYKFYSRSVKNTLCICREWQLLSLWIVN